MKTYLQVSFNSEGSRPSVVLNILMNMGFKPMKGAYDFVYEWDRNSEVEDLVWFGDKIHESLKGHNVTYKMESDLIPLLDSSGNYSSYNPPFRLL